MSTRAHRTLSAARDLARLGYRRDAVSRAYYAAFYAARAAVQAAGSDAGTHKGIATEFSRLLVRTSRVPHEMSAVLRRLATARVEADYDDGESLTRDEVADLLASAARFINTVEGPDDTTAAPDTSAMMPDQKRDLIAQLAREMEEASEALEFERAAELRDLIAQIEATLAA